MDPGLLALGALAAGATALLRSFSKTRKEGFDVVPAAGYPTIANEGQQMYNRLTLASDPRQEVNRLVTMPQSQQNAYEQAINAATSTPINVPTGNGNIQVQTQTTAVPAYVPDQTSIMRRAIYCENKLIDDGVFNDSQFGRDCGVCLSGGRTNEGATFKGIKGLFIEPSSRAELLAAKTATDAKYTLARPTLGFCEGATGGAGHDYTYAVTKDELKAFRDRKGCQTSKQLDGNCATCLQDGSFTYVGKDGTQLDTITFTVAGLGTLSATVGGKVIEFGSPTKDATGNLVKVVSVQLSQRPVSFRTTALEDSLLVFTVVAPDADTPGELYGVMEAPNTTGGVIQIPLDKILVTDDMMGGKPRRARTFPTITTPNGTAYCAKLISGFTKSSMILTGNVPFLVVNDYAFDGIDCKGSLLQQKPSSVERFGGDPCYKPASQGQGTWTDACLKDRIVSYGCVEAGDLYKNPSELRGLTMDGIRTNLQGIAEKQFSDTVSSKKCNGKDISTPCDAYVNFNVNETPDISPQCIKFLYDNGGVDTPAIGPTYTGPINTYYSLDSKGRRIYCLPSGTDNPDTNPTLVKQLQKDSRSGKGTGRIGIPYVKDHFNAAYQRATNTGLNANIPDSQGGRAESIARCYSKLSDIPIYSIPPSPDASLPNSRFCRVRYPPGRREFIQIAQVAVYDNRGINIARGKHTSTNSLYQFRRNGQLTSDPANAVNGQLFAKGPAEEFGRLYTSNYDANAFWMVDLGETYPVSSVEFYNRADCCQFRASGLILELLDKDNKPVWSTTLTGAMVQKFSTAPKMFNI
jgi:hypothetical protein